MDRRTLLTTGGLGLLGLGFGGCATRTLPAARPAWATIPLGIVKLSGIAMIDPQHTVFATGLEPIILGVGQPDSA